MKDCSNPSRRELIAGLGALAAAGAVPVSAWAADGDWPTRPVKIIVANPPGQAVDIVGRLFAESFSKTFGQPFVVDNKPGAGGLTATAIGSHAPPDGYTLLISSSGPLVVTPAIKKGMPYDSLKDFTHIGNIALTPQVLIVGAGSPFKTVKDVIDAAKAKPGQLNYATSGIGSTSHLGMEAFCSAVGVKMTHIPYKGNQEALTQLISGDVALGSDTVPGALAMIKAGKLRALGIAAPDRSPFIPDVPTLAEQGYKVEALGWIGLSAPAGLPRATLDKLNRAIQAALATPEFKEKFTSLALVSIAGTPEQFEGFVRSELGKWSAVAKAANVQVE
ncbi:Bug family tripartite tricarboxylate transporter substrate binding protein [Caenimonas aquaedulcis]|uniref:Tripartite tricarboxylate transporter substrate binding protein n=1 Tax=Caenimonas aquaedulcis TaxID=2793270 RepID=A0A931MGE1_9BURK|nr:tripartite tricarboxylate transporter substrate binding protein [Caenimonas aquaedulcis]MBG9387962.1 tripartite tricarboxylate transporter substrate binding protein [Caenimonas aquaedulcis]